VGSTSVPGLDSKPVIDILIGVKNLNTADQMIPEMVKLGFEYVSEFKMCYLREDTLRRKKLNIYIQLSAGMNSETGLSCSGIILD